MIYDRFNLKINMLAKYLRGKLEVKLYLLLHIDTSMCTHCNATFINEKPAQSLL